MGDKNYREKEKKKKKTVDKKKHDKKIPSVNSALGKNKKPKW